MAPHLARAANPVPPVVLEPSVHPLHGRALAGAPCLGRHLADAALRQRLPLPLGFHLRPPALRSMIGRPSFWRISSGAVHQIVEAVDPTLRSDRRLTCTEADVSRQLTGMPPICACPALQARRRCRRSHLLQRHRRLPPSVLAREFGRGGGLPRPGRSSPSMSSNVRSRSEKVVPAGCSAGFQRPGGGHVQPMPARHVAAGPDALLSSSTRTSRS